MMTDFAMTKFLSCLLFSLVLVVTPALAKEPANLETAKQAVIHYHDSGEYNRDVSNVIEQAMRFLKMRLDHPTSGKKPAIVLDIDETSLSNYAHLINMNFGGTLAEMRIAEDDGSDPAIEPTLKLYRFAKENHVAVFFITGRTDVEREATIANLKKAGYTAWDALFFKPDVFKGKPAEVYKTAIRKQLTDMGYDIIINVGDQKSDLSGGYADKTFKLPNPYYFIP